MKQGIFFIVVTGLILSNCAIQKDVSNEKPCSTNYPVILVHGIGMRDDLGIVKYWSKIPKVLEKNGARVFLANQDAFNTHAENAVQLSERVLDILHQTGAQKVNLIAHSKGGLEARFMITKLGMADKVASLTTLASPHRGSFLADTVLSWLAKKSWLDDVLNLANNYGHFSGDEKPNAFIAAKNLTQGYMKHFNQSVPDMPQVYYQSYGGMVTQDYPGWKIRFQHRIMSEAEGENDCTVSKKSYQWGNFRGVARSEQEFGVSHFDIVGMKFVSKQSTFDAEGFFIKIVKGLKEKGF